MGKGDKRTRRGKIYNGSYGKKRPHTARKPGDVAGTATAAAPRTGKAR
jgi:30S ribosomal protein S31